MLGVRTILLACTVLVVSVPTVEAGWHEFWNRVHLDFHRNNCWPEPFSTIDKRAAAAPFVAMVNSGWRTQNTLGEHYFHHETNVLNDAGRRKLFWILTNAPAQNRTIYVSRSYEPEVGERRLDSVQRALAHMLPEQDLPAVIPTDHEPRGAEAQYVDTIDRKARTTIPAPRLPSFQSAGGL